MNNLDCLVRALAHIKEAESLITSFVGAHDFLDLTEDCFSDAKRFIADSITLNATLQPTEQTIPFEQTQPKPLLAKLDVVKVQEIIKRIGKGESYDDISRDYGVSRQCIKDIATGRTWRNRGDRCHLAKLDEGKVKEIIARIDMGEPYDNIAKDYGVHNSCISKIATGTSWAHVPRPNGYRFKSSRRRRRVATITASVCA